MQEESTRLAFWPTPQDYNEAVQNCHFSLFDVALQSATVLTDGKGLPRPISGGFASVYKLTGADREWALRCFLHDIPDAAWRYQQISNFVLNDKLPYTVNFDYQPRGLHVRDQWFPVLKMDWVHGETLEQYLIAHVQDKQALESLCCSFAGMCADLQDAGIAHGDLQHGNILVNDGKLYLVDYDGMYVPSMHGSFSTELGHPNYQHPARNAQHFGDYLDNFSAWVIYTSLYAIAADPQLFQRLGAGEDCLLFRRCDFLNPLESCAFAALESHRQSEIGLLARFIRSQVAVPLEQVPPLSSLSTLTVDELPPLSSGVPTNRQAWLQIKGSQVVVAADQRSKVPVDFDWGTTGQYAPALGGNQQVWRPAEVELLQPIPRQVRFDGPSDDPLQAIPFPSMRALAVFVGGNLIAFSMALEAASKWLPASNAWGTAFVFASCVSLPVAIGLMMLVKRRSALERSRNLVQYGAVTRGRIARLPKGDWGSARYAQALVPVEYSLDDGSVDFVDVHPGQLDGISEGQVVTVLRHPEYGSVIYRFSPYRAVV